MARAIRASASSAVIVHSEKGFDSRKLDEGRMAHPSFGMPSALRAQLWSAQNCSLPNRKHGLEPPTNYPRCRSAAFSDREQVDKSASLDGKGRPSCHERPLLSDAWSPQGRWECDPRSPLRLRTSSSRKDHDRRHFRSLDDESGSFSFANPVPPRSEQLLAARPEQGSSQTCMRCRT